MQQINQSQQLNLQPQLVIAIDVATKVSGIAIFYEQILVATWSLILNPDLNFGANKVVADLTVIDQLLSHKLVQVINFLKTFGLNLQRVGIIVEQSLHDHHNVSQKIHFYSGLMIATIDQALKAHLGSFQLEIKMLPPSEWMLRLFNQQLDRQAGKNFSKQQALNLIYQQQPYLKHYYQLDHPWYYDYSAYDDNQADAINIGFNYQGLRDVATIKAQRTKTQLELKKLQQAMKRIETKLKKYQHRDLNTLKASEQRQLLQWQSDLATKKAAYEQLQAPVLIDANHKQIDAPIVQLGWQDQLIKLVLNYGWKLTYGQFSENLIKQYLKTTFKRKFYCNQDYLIKDGYLEIINSNLKAKKITGSRFNQTIDVGRYQTLFSTWCKYWNLDLPVFNQKYVNAGNVVEDRLVAWLNTTEGMQYLNRFEVPVVKIKAIKGNDCNWDYFANEPVFGGIPDAIVTLANGKEIILEFKSAMSKKRQQWIDQGIPQQYVEQAMLYCYLNQTQDFVIINYWLEANDYEDLDQLVIDQSRIYSGWYQIDVNRIEKLMDRAQNQYQSYYLKPISPAISNLTVDQNLLAYLKITNEDEYENYLWNLMIEFLNGNDATFDRYWLLKGLVAFINNPSIS